MNQTRQLTKSMTMGDAAVDGLLGGLGASIVMALVLVVLGLTGGQAPLSTLIHFDPSGSSALTGALMHLAAGGVYGALFGMGWHLAARSNLPGWLAGIIYGLALLALAEGVILPGAHSPLLAIPLWQFAIAHIVYGLTMGWSLNRKWRD